MQNPWSTQILVPVPVVKKDATTQSATTEQTLIVCVEGQQLFNEHFVNGKYKGEDTLGPLAFDFIVLGGVPCPRGKFYEVDYTLGGKFGTVYRALIQAVDPVTDLRIILGLLNHKGIITDEIFTHKAYLRTDIEAVNICRCLDEQDGNGPCCYGGHVCPRPEDTVSILDKSMGKDPSFPEFAASAMCFEYWDKDHCVEVWLNPNDKFDTKPVFVVGSKNVWDEDFAEMRDADLSELEDHLTEAQRILDEYGLSYILINQSGHFHPNPDGTKSMGVNLAVSSDSTFIEQAFKVAAKMRTDSNTPSDSSSNE